MFTHRFTLLSSSIAAGLCAAVLLWTPAIAANMVTLTKTDNHTTALPGEVLTYSLTVGNTTARPKTVVVQDTLPSTLQFRSASHNGHFIRGARMVLWLVKVPPLSSSTVTVEVSVLPTVKNGTVITNVATAQAMVKATDTTVVQVPSSSSSSSSSVSSSSSSSSSSTSSNSSSSSTSSSSTSSSSSSTSSSSSSSSSISLSSSSSSVATAKLVIAQKNIGSTNVAVKNQKNINLLRFEARNTTAQDILLTKFIFSALAGSLNNGQNYMLWVDTDKSGNVDTILQKAVSPIAGKITFSQITGGGYVVPAGQDVLFEAHSDVAPSLTNDSLQLQFSTADTYVEAESPVNNGQALAGIRTNGVCPQSTCDTTVTTVSSMLWTLVSQGNLFVSQDTTPVRSRQSLGGALGDAILRLSFGAWYEDIDVTDIQFSQLNGTTTRSLDRLDLYKEGATTPFGTATIGGCGSDITPPQTLCVKMQARQLIIPQGSNVKVLVRPRMKDDVNGAVSGDPIQIFLASTAVANNTTGEGAVRARGDMSSNALIANNGNATADGEIFIGRTAPASTNQQITGLPNVTVLSRISSISNANPDPNGSAVPVGIADVGQFKFSAAAHGNSKNGLNKVVLNYLYFNVNAVNVVLDGATMKFYNKANGTVTTACSPMLSNGTLLSGSITEDAFIVKCGGLTSTAVNTTIDQGTDQTFVLQMNITNPKESAISTSALQVSLINFDSIALTALGPSAAESHFEWIDTDAGASTPLRWVEYPDTTVKSTGYQG